MKVKVIGAGLAGTEAAWQLAQRNIQVALYEMKPQKMSPAHHSPLFAELVCSNSLRSDRIVSASGLLKAELRLLGSVIMEGAEAAKVPAGSALAVDRNGFAAYVTQKIIAHPMITVVNEEVTEVPDGEVIIATGPLTSDQLAINIAQLPGLSQLCFYDASAPIVIYDSLDKDNVFRQSRYGKGDDYLNCFMSKPEYEAFVTALLGADTAELHGFEEKKIFEGCMPIESMARRGLNTLAFGPMKPVGLTDPRTGKRAYAVVQLRQENKEGTLYNMVGFQTRLKHADQKRVFSMIPGFAKAEFARYGVMHRNTFIHSPGYLNDTYQVIINPNIFFAGQITGVEGYLESVSSGMVAGINMAKRVQGADRAPFPSYTAIGSLASYISTKNASFQPMNCSYGLIQSPGGSVHGRKKSKAERYTEMAERSLVYVNDFMRKQTDIARQDNK